MQGRGSYRLDPATSIQVQKYTVYRTLPVLKSGTVLLFARSLFLGVRHLEKYQKKLDR